MPFVNRDDKPTVFECDICGHNFDTQRIIEFGSDILWVCFLCTLTRWKEIGEMLIEMEE